MKNCALAFVLFLLCLPSFARAQEYALTDATVTLCFTPGPQSCAARLTDTLSTARSSIAVQAFLFSSKEVAQALVAAQARGVDVRVLLDGSHRKEKKSVAPLLWHAGVPTFLDTAHATAHNKVMVIDAQVVVTGSYNYTKTAEEKNAENLLIIRSRTLAEAYLRNFEAHMKHADKYEGAFRN